MEALDSKINWRELTSDNWEKKMEKKTQKKKDAKKRMDDDFLRQKGKIFCLVYQGTWDRHTLVGSGAMVFCYGFFCYVFFTHPDE